MFKLPFIVIYIILLFWWSFAVLLARGITQFFNNIFVFRYGMFMDRILQRSFTRCQLKHSGNPFVFILPWRSALSLSTPNNSVTFRYIFNLWVENQWPLSWHQYVIPFTARTNPILPMEIISQRIFKETLYFLSICLYYSSVHFLSYLTFTRF